MLTVAIQAGGRSRRIGQDKGLMRLGDRTLIEHVISRVEGLSQDILVITPRPDDYAFTGLRLASDPLPGGGPLVGLHTALTHARHATVLVVACDMPFLSRPLLEHLLSLASDADVVVPLWHGEYEPLHAVYDRACLPAIQAALAADQRRMVSFFGDVRVHPVPEAEIRAHDPEGLTFFNINESRDLEAAQRLLARHDPR